MSPTMRRWIVLAALAGLALRLAFGLGYWVGKPLTRDEREYLSLARSLAHGQGYRYDAALDEGAVVPFGRAPGYPAFLALVGGGGAPAAAVPTAVKVAQAMVGAATIFLFGWLGARVAGPRAGVAAAWIAAVYPPFIWIGAYALSEVVYIPLGLLTVLVYDAVASGRAAPSGAGGGLACGVLAGLGALVRAATVIFLPLALLWLAWRRRWIGALGLTLGFAVVVGPWTVRNALVSHRFVLIASDGGVTFWTGNNSLAHGEGDLAANADLALANVALRAAHPGLSETDMEPVYYRAALDWIRAHPLDWLTLEVKKAYYTVAPTGPSYRLHSSRYLVTTLVSYGLLLPLGLAGFVKMGARRGATPGLWLLVASSIAICLVFFPQERFRIPVIDPALVIGAAALAAAPRARARQGAGAKPPGPGERAVRAGAGGAERGEGAPASDAEGGTTGAKPPGPRERAISAGAGGAERGKRAPASDAEGGTAGAKPPGPSLDALVVLPTYNERANLEAVVTRVLAHEGLRLLVVDDGSPDGTGALADALAARWPKRVEVLHRHGPRGLGRAYIDGLRHALEGGAAVICQMDADLSHDPVYLPALIAALADDDVAIGSRYLHGVSVVNWPLHRIVLSAFANAYIRAITGLAPRDCTSGFRAWRREALAQLPLDHPEASGYAFLTEMLFQAARRGCRIGEVPIIFVERQEGYSKVSSHVLLESLLTPWRLVARGGRVGRPRS